MNNFAIQYINTEGSNKTKIHSFPHPSFSDKIKFYPASIVAFRWGFHNHISELQMDKKFKSNIKVKTEEKRKETEEPIYLLRC